MSSSPLISVIMPCYNGADTLERALRSIATQSYRNVEAILINDGSTDHSWEVMNSFVWPTTFRLVSITRKRCGFLASIIEGAEASSGDYLARLDCDDYWEREHLEVLLGQFQKDSDLVLVGSLARCVDTNGRFICDYNVPLGYPDIIRYLHRDNPFVHSGVMMTKEAYIASGGYSGDGLADASVADYRLWFELTKLGKCQNVDNRTVVYTTSETSMSRSIDLIENYKARLRVMRMVAKEYRKYAFYSAYYRAAVLIKLILLEFKSRFI